MSLARQIQAVELQFSRESALHTRTFTEARSRHAVLAPFETLEDLRRAAVPSGTLSTARSNLIGALVQEAQRGTSPVWSSLLLIAFAPMLCRFRSRITSRVDADLDSAILCAFLNAVHAVPVSNFTSLALRWATEKEVLAARRAERRLGQMDSFDEELHTPPVPGEVEAATNLDDILRALDQEGAAEIVDVLLATRGRDESLRAYVARVCPDPKKRAALYENLCRARLRLEREIRRRLTPKVGAA
ncbi:MAG TPA: hypothetical protein VGI39_07800 [Polyangiaceae bacterium]|jgi:hypothetical protein